MKTLGIHLIAGGSYPACDVHIDTVFQDLVAVQFMSGGSLYFQREGFPRQEWTQPVFFWTDTRSHYQYGPGETGSWNHHWVNFRGKAVHSHILPLLENLAPSGVLPVNNPLKIQNLMDGLIHFVLSPSSDPTESIHNLHLLLASVHEGKPGKPEPDGRILQIQQDMDDTPGADWNFHDLARKNGMSYSQFRRRFREHSGQAPGHYLTACRIRSSARLLQSTRRTIQEIGEQIGYPDPAHFSKAFKQQYGISPRSYRQSMHPFQDRFSKSGSSS